MSVHTPRANVHRNFEAGGNNRPLGRLFDIAMVVF